MGAAEKTAQFARLFLAPGVDHGFRGAGALVQARVGEGGAVQSSPGGNDGEIELLEHLLKVAFLCRAAGGLMEDGARQDSKQRGLDGWTSECSIARNHPLLCVFVCLLFLQQ
jgi:hypothetical protein